MLRCTIAACHSVCDATATASIVTKFDQNYFSITRNSTATSFVQIPLRSDKEIKFSQSLENFSRNFKSVRVCLPARAPYIKPTKTKMKCERANMRCMQNIKRLTAWCKMMEICSTFLCLFLFFIDDGAGGAHPSIATR